MRSESRIEVFEVVAVPRHERDQHVPAKREFAEIGRGTVGDDVALLHVVRDLHQRALVDAGVLVGTLKLHQPVDVDAGLGRVGLVGGADDDTGGVDLIDHASAPCRDRRAGIPRDDPFHAGADERRLGVDKRHRLPLHVGAHERAVGVIVLKERNECRCHRNELFRRHVHEVHFVGRQKLHVAGVTHDDEVIGEAALAVDSGVGLRHRITTFFHRREINHLVGYAAVLSLCDTASRRSRICSPARRSRAN